MRRIPFADHFAIPWAAGRSWLLEGTNPYEISVAELADTAINESGLSAVLPDETDLFQPLINLFIYLPFILIPYRISRAIWVTLSLLATGLSVILAIKLSGWKLSFIERTVIILMYTFWLPGAFSIITGQLTPIIILIFLFSITLIMNGQDTTAGFLLALTFGSLLTSIIILLFLTIWAVSMKKWTLLKAYFAGLAFILVLSWLLLPSWFMDWLSIIIPKLQNLAWVQTPLLTIAALLPGIEKFLGIFLHVMLGVFLLIQLITVVKESRQKFVWKLFIIFIIAFLFNLQPSMAHLLLVLPALIFVFRFWVERWRIFGRLLSMGIILLLSIGSWLLALPDLQITEQDSTTILMVGLPIIVLVSMLWIRWWAFRIPKFESEKKFNA